METEFVSGQPSFLEGQVPLNILGVLRTLGNLEPAEKTNYTHLKVLTAELSTTHLFSISLLQS